MARRLSSDLRMRWQARTGSCRQAVPAAGDIQMAFKCSVLRAPVSVILMALFTACGGGGESPAPTAADSSLPATTPAAESFDVGSLVGSWAGCRAVSDDQSILSEYVFTRLGDNTLSVRTNYYSYSGTTCNGSLVTWGGPAYVPTYTFGGTKLVGTEQVRKVAISAPPGGLTGKDILVLRQDGKLYFGRRIASPVDEEGYPDLLWPFGYAKE
jgi:hypothetical protein